MYTIYGRVKYYDDSGVCQGYVTGGWIKPYFKKVDSSSSNSKWSTNPYQLDPLNEGYFSFDVEDSDILGPEGVYRKGTDKLYLAFYWNENDNLDKDKDSKNITHAALVEHTLLTGVDDFELNLTMAPSKGPNITSFSLPSDEVKTKQNLTMSETSILDESFFTPTNCSPEWFRINIAQKRIHDGITVFDSYKISNTSYDWGDSVNIITKSLAGTTSNTHQYSVAGNYSVSILATTEWGGISKKTKNIKVKYNSPNTDFNWNPIQTNDNKIKGKETITFNNITSDLDNRSDVIYKYEWVIEDKNLDNSDNTKIYLNKDKSFKPSHSFMSPGVKNITLRTYWNDGFSDLISEKVKQITIYSYIIDPNFSWDKIVSNRSESVTFTNISTGDVNRIVSVNWMIPDNWPVSAPGAYTFLDNETNKFGEGSANNAIRVDNTYNIFNNTCSVKLHSNELRQIEMNIVYNDGWSEKTLKKIKSYTPNSYVLNPTIGLSSNSPIGRNDSVVITNITNDTLGLQYESLLEIYDFYMALNIDNPTPGVIKNNNKIYSNLNPIFSINHKFQNTDSNKVFLKIWYDNGWQKIESDIETYVKPILTDIPNIDFIWTDENNIKSRFVNVSFSDITVDINHQYINSTWTINDEFELYNPNNPKYGVSNENNTKIYPTNDKNFKPEHNFQSNKNHEIILSWKYDDGFCESVIEKTKILNTLQYDISPDFYSIPSNNHLGEIQYINSTEDSSNIILDIDWEFHDKDGLNGDTDHVYTFENKLKTDIILNKWKFAPRKPFSCSSNPAISNNINKSVIMSIRYDNGWNDNNIKTKIKNFTAITNEIDIIGESVNNEYSGKDIYGTEEVKFTAKIEDLNNAVIPNTLTWLIQDFDITGNDLTSNETLMDLSYEPIKKFQSPGNKLVTTSVHFDDGYGNIYLKDYDFSVDIKPYIKPEFDITWSPLHPTINQTVTFNSIFNDTRPHGKIERILIDYDNNLEFDKIDINNDNIADVWEIQKDTVFYNKMINKTSVNTVRLNINWNDGWNHLNFDIIKDIIMSAVAPEVNLNVTKIQYNNYKLEIIASDPDGEVEEYKFDVYFKNPAVDSNECIINKTNSINLETNYCTKNEEFGEYIKVSESDWINNNVLWKKLSSNGHYKIEGFAKDNDGLVSSDIKEIYIESPLITTQPPTGDIIICTKRCLGGVVKVYPFEVNILKGESSNTSEDDDF